MAGEATASGLRFFLDRGLGSVVVPRALRAAGWTLETMDERYGADQSQNIQDTQWIEERRSPALRSGEARWDLNGRANTRSMVARGGLDAGIADVFVDDAALASRR
jgi:hypothetical protein